MNTCNNCRCNKVCNHDLYGFENCNNYIPTENHMPKTNFDRIKAMSVEEMAKIIQCPEGRNSDQGKRNCLHDISCYQCKKQWLESEVSE